MFHIPLFMQANTATFFSYFFNYFGSLSSQLLLLFMCLANLPVKASFPFRNLMELRQDIPFKCPGWANISPAHSCGCITDCCHLIVLTTQTAVTWPERAWALWTCLGKLLKCCGRTFQGNGGDHRATSAEEAGNDWITKTWVTYKRALWWRMLNYGKPTEGFQLKMKAKVFRRVEKNNSVPTIKTTDQLISFSSTISRHFIKILPGEKPVQI